MAIFNTYVRFVISIIVGGIDCLYNGRCDSLQALWAEMNAIISAKIDFFPCFVRHGANIGLIQMADQGFG